MAETNGKHEQLTVNQLAERLQRDIRDIAANVSLQRADLFKSLLDPRRSYDDECGYPALNGENVDLFRNLYDRFAIATRVVQCMPKESWQVQPSIVENEDPEDVTDFEEAWDNLGVGLTPNGRSWFKTEAGSLIWDELLNFDILSRIGHFGVMLMGIDDGKNLQEPVDGVLAFNGKYPCFDSPPTESEEKLMLKEARPEDWLPSIEVARDKAGEPLFRVPTANERRGGFGYRPTVNEQRWWDHVRSYRQLIANKLAANAQVDTGDPRFFRQSASVPSSIRDLRNPAEAPPPGAYISGTDREYDNAAGPEGGKQFSQGPFGLGTGGAGYDNGYDLFGSGLGLPPATLSGTDQQYFGVQYGPSEVLPYSPTPKPHKLLFLKAFDESLVQIVRYEWNIRNPRFGLPVMYRITLNDPREQHSGVGLPLATVYVHWTRVIHLCDRNANAGASSIFAPPVMRPVLNRLIDMIKLYGGSAEMYWRGAFPGLSFETNPSLGGDVQVNLTDLQSQYEQYINGLQRAIMTSGMTIKTLSPTVSDPGGHIQKQLEAVCIQLAIPFRVFQGSERGVEAAAQDDSKWNDVLRARQKFHTTPRVIVPFVDRLIHMGVLPEPSEYNTIWPDLESEGAKDKAAIFVQRMQGLSTFISGGCEQAMTLKDMYIEEMGYTDEKAQELVDAAQKEQDKKDKENQGIADEHGFEPTPPPGFSKPKPEVPGQPPGQQPKPPKQPKSDGDESDEDESETE